MSLEFAKARVRGWVRAGARILEVAWEDAELAGEYLLKTHRYPHG